MKKNTNKIEVVEVVKVTNRIAKYVQAIGVSLTSYGNAKKAVLEACKGLKGQDDYDALKKPLKAFLEAVKPPLSEGTIKGYMSLVRREGCGLAPQNGGNTTTPEKQAARDAIKATEEALSAKQAGTKAHTEGDTIESATNKLLNILTTLKEGEIVQVLAQIGMDRLIPLIHAMNEFVSEKTAKKNGKK